VDRLVSELNYFGLLFEFLSIRDLRIYAAADNLLKFAVSRQDRRGKGKTALSLMGARFF